MKTIHQLNSWALAINALLFIIPWFGMIAMIPLGVIQLIMAAGISINYLRHLDSKHKKLMGCYWLLVLIDLLGILYLWYNDSRFYQDFLIVVILFIIPGCTAFYFAYATYSITRYLNSHGDTTQQQYPE